MREAFFNFLVGPMVHDLDTHQLSEQLQMEFSAYFSLKLGFWGPFKAKKQARSGPAREREREREREID